MRYRTHRHQGHLLYVSMYVPTLYSAISLTYTLLVLYQILEFTTKLRILFLVSNKHNILMELLFTEEAKFLCHLKRIKHFYVPYVSIWGGRGGIPPQATKNAIPPRSTLI